MQNTEYKAAEEAAEQHHSVKKRKVKFTFFSDHNGSLLRQQPGASSLSKQTLVQTHNSQSVTSDQQTMSTAVDMLRYAPTRSQCCHGSVVLCQAYHTSGSCS